MKNFVEQLNDLIAPMTRAWVEPEIQKVIIEPGSITEADITVTVVVKLSRSGASPVQLSNAKYVKSLYGQLTAKSIKTNAIAGEGPKRGVR